MQELINRIHDIPIRDIIEKHAQLTKAGINLKGKCPFPGHNEKTPSFIVNPNKNRCWCYGCQKGGDAITFIQIIKGYAKPWDAILDIAKAYNLPIPEKRELTKEDQEKYRLREQLKIVYEAAGDYYKSQLFVPENALALEYLMNRTHNDIIEKFEIGIAPSGWQGLYDHLRKKGFKDEILLQSKLISEKNGKLFDFFRERILFPITDRTGSVIAFTGRALPWASKDSPKYLNSPETPVFSKSHTLFGLSHARAAIAKKEGAYLVEGNFDVTRLVSLSVENVVAPCGTALTPEQIAEIKRHTDNVIMIYDGDDAGAKAIERSGNMLVEAGMNCNVIELRAKVDKSDASATASTKADPDSFFSTTEDFKYYKEENLQDFIIWKTNKISTAVKNFPDRKQSAIHDICSLILKYPGESRREMYLEECAGIIPNRKIWNKEIGALTKEKPKKESERKVPQGLDMADVHRWGFYIDGNCYFFRKGDDYIEGSNFIMRPLFHIPGMNAKRLYEIENEVGTRLVIELLQKDLVSLPAFRLRIESLGNFLWKAGEPELGKLKSYLYGNTDTCFEITQLGWQKQGFFAWANGIFNGEFSPIDSHGIVNHSGKKFYLPALSDIYENEDTLFMSERRFVHLPKNNISFYDYASRLISVFGPNAKIAIAFYLATLYRDIIVKRFNFFPILNLFGPKGAGKTELAVSIMAFFGRQAKGPNINNTTKASLADHVAQVSNACVHIDEYKNNIEYEKIEFMKGLWDGTGRTRMNMDKDKKKETTAVDCGVILSGQEMPTADIALFSRLIYLTFNKVEYTDVEKKQFDELKEIEKKGLTHITNQCLSHRAHFLEKYMDAYDKTCAMLNGELKADVIEDRLFKNWATVLAAFVCIEETGELSVPFNSEELIKQAAKQLFVQQQQTRTGNEVTSFWNIVQYLYADGQIQEESDFSIKALIRLKTQLADHEWRTPKRVIFIQHSRIMPLYQKYGKASGEKTLPKESIDFYIRNDRRFLGKKLGHPFRNIDPKTGSIDEKNRWKVTNAYAFDYDALSEEIGITLHADAYNPEDGDLFQDETQFPVKNNVPF